MMKELLLKLKASNIDVKVIEGNLKLHIPDNIDASDIINEVKINKEKLIEYISQRLNNDKFNLIHKANEQLYYSLSSAQKRLFLFQQKDLDSVAYNMPFCISLNKKVVIEKIEEIFLQLIYRHESLRTSFEVREEELVQKIHNQVNFKVERHCIDKSKEKETRNNFIRAFDLSQPPLLRVALVEVKGENPLLMIDMHHIISDDTSQRILKQEFELLYSGETLVPLRLQYKDYSEWQNSQEQKNKIKSQEEYWIKKFEDEIPVLNLPTDYFRPTIQSQEGAVVSFTLSSEETDNLKLLLKENGLTMYMSVLSVFTILLSKLSGQDDIVIGSPIAGRNHADFENTVGMFVNTLAIRNKIRGDYTLKEFVGKLKQNTLDAYTSQDYQFDDLVEKVSVKRDISRNPIFDVMFNLLTYTEISSDLTGHNNQVSSHEPCVTKFDMLLLGVDNGEQLLLRFEYCTKLFKASTINRYIKYLKQIISQLNNSEIKLSEIEILSEEDKHQLLYEFNTTQADYPKDKTIHELFEEQAEQLPNNCALIFKEESISYKELNEKSNQLANYLRSKGAKSNCLIGIMLERSIEMIISILGILKSGGAYLPLDPAYPLKRIKYILDDCQINIIITSESLKDKLQFEDQIIDIADPFIYHEDSRNLLNINTPLDASYIIYTSGTTGNPKGVIIEHKNVVRLLFNNKNLFDFSSNDIWTMFHSYSFDFSVWEIYGALLYGGKLIIVSKMLAKDSKMYLELLKNEEVTILNQTPSAFYNLIQEELQIKENQLQLRYIIFGGEALNPTKLEKWHKKYPRTKLINMFGITETTVHVTYKEITKKEISHGISNIGKPIPTLNTYVMDANQKLLPIGVAGELCVGGEGVSRGYINRNTLTESRFVNNPYKKGERLYRSGDLVKLLSNGEMEYLGRIDQQVQINGFRIELGEIEAQLFRLENINEAIVVDKEDKKGNKYLCAYYISNEKNDISEMRQKLSYSLPDYMIPLYFIQLETIPLTSSGKIDRKLLPDPEYKQGDKYDAPTNNEEQLLAEIWGDVLNIDKIGIDTDYFHIGGDSIKAIRLISRINTRFNSCISVADLYTNSTIKKLVQRINEKQLNKQSTIKAEEVRIRILKLEEKILLEHPDASDIEEIFPMTDIAQGIVFYYLKNIGSGVYHDQFINQYAYKNFKPERLKKALYLLVEKHEVLRSCFNLEDFEEPIQIVYKNPILKFENFDIRNLERDKQEELIQTKIKEDIENPFDEKMYPLWRMQTYQLNEHDFVLLFMIHHAIIDGWSISSFMVELNNIYLELGNNTDFIPQKINITFKDVILHQIVEKQNFDSINYWKTELSGYERTELLINSNKDKSQKMTLRSYDYGSEIIKDLENLAKESQSSLVNLCFGAYIYTLNLFTYSREIVAGYVSNFRPALEDGDKILGCFLNTVPVRIKVPKKIKIADYIQFIDQKMLEIKEYDKMPLFEIARIIGERNKDENPIFDTIFNLMNFHVFEQANTNNYIGIETAKNNNLVIEGSSITNTLFDFEVNITNGLFYLQPKYNTSLISHDFVERFCLYYIRVLRQFLEKPNSFLSKNSIISQKEKDEILIEFNKTEQNYNSNKTLSELFEIQVKKTPNNLAIITDKGEISYKELNIRANKIALSLRKLGVKSGSLVSIIIGRSNEMIAGVIGILKSGGAYVPIEPNLPEARIERLLKELNVKIVITDSKRLKKVGEIVDNISTTKHLIVLDEPKEIEEQHKLFKNTQLLTLNDIEKNSPINLKQIAKSDDVAYIIFTSGSTGLPKGVVEQHKPVLNVIEWINKSFSVKETDKLLFIASLSFDLSVYDIFGILSCGASIRLLSNKEVKDPNRILQILLTENITIWDSAPAALQQLVPLFPQINKNNKLRLALLSGDWIPLILPDKLKETFEGVNVISLGGATEATIWSNYYPIKEINPNWNSIPYGKPIQNARYYILDNNLEICPKGVSGDLYIGGECLALGYINDPELSNTKFINNPVISGEKIYKTGDLARFMHDGNIEFLGRKDNQVKIRGFRIELGEIENTLLKHKDIKDSIVIVRESDTGDKYLCAYFIIKNIEKDIKTESQKVLTEKIDLHKYLIEYLPEYMIPSYFIEIDKIPLTQNGKVNRSALPSPEFNTGDEYVAPSSELEKKLTVIWSDILSIPKEEISVTANFFAVGGHSLKVTVLIGKIDKEIGVKFPLGDIFVFSTIKEQASQIELRDKNVYVSILPSEDLEFYPLSSAQKRLYLLQQFDLDSTTYNIPYIISIGKELDKSRIEEIFQKLILRHESLRTSFEMINDEPVQRIHDHIEINVEEAVIDESEIKGFLDKFTRSFNLSQPPLIRLALVKVKGGGSLLVVDMHHIISDWLSHAVLEDEFKKIYLEEELHPLQIQYKDFCEWKNSKEIKEKIKLQATYWKDKFSGDIPELNLPTDFIRPSILSHEGATVNFSLSPDETEMIRYLSKENGLTLYMSLLSVFTIFLSKLSGQEDIIVGTPTSGRNHNDLKNIVGMFVNTLAIRSELNINETYKEFASIFKQNVIEAFENQDYQFENLVEDVSVNRDTSRNPIFSVMFNMLNQGEYSGNIIDFDNTEHVSGISKFDMTLTAIENEKQLLFDLEYSVRLFRKESINRFIQFFKKLITQLCKHQDGNISELEIITDEEKQQILYEFNNTKEEYSKNKLIVELFEEQVLMSSKETAIITNGISYSYEWLNSVSNQLANLLRENGVQRESSVVIILDRSIELIVTLFGILKAGGKYVPIEPYIPVNRKESILNSVQAEYIITNKKYHSDINSLKDKISSISKAYFMDVDDSEVLNVNELNENGFKEIVLESYSSFNLERINESDDLAYVIFTSGSSGQPKGVAVQHKPVINLIEWVNKTYNISYKDTVLLVSSISFDLSVYDIFGLLAAGGKVRIANEDELVEPDILAKVIVEEGITFWDSAPALLQQIIPFLQNRSESANEKGKLRLCFLSGDWIPLKMPQQMKELFKDLDFIALGGATEATVWSNFYEVLDINKNWKSIPYGKPIQNAKYLILDKERNLCPVGIAGDLYIGGECLAKEYINDKELSERKFISNPFNTGEILYSTGDMARWFNDGNIEFLGRVDNQVKIRGFRIELGEIESILLKYLEVKECVVIAHGERINKFICAYIVSDKDINQESLRDYLGSLLPAYMIPPYFIQLNSIPITVNGKVDYKALPKPEVKAGEDYSAPSNEFEERLVEIWSDVLNVPNKEISINDNFFAIGGQSLKASILLLRIHKEFSVNISLYDIFKNPTVHEQAMIIEIVNKSSKVQDKLNIKKERIII